MNLDQSTLSTTPGVAISVIRNGLLGILNSAGPGFPLLLRARTRLAPPPFSTTLTYPLSPQITDSIDIFNPNIKTPYAQTWTGGIRRKLSKDIGLEVRYVGTRHLQGWDKYDLNEPMIVENGFLKEFRLAQANLQANIAAGRGNTFAYTGVPGTSPLPIYLAYFSGIASARAGDPAVYTSSSFCSTHFTNPLAVYNPNPLTPAGTNATTAPEGDPIARANATAAA